MSIFIEKSKTDRYREGNSVAISRTPEITCPVRMVARYLQLANIADSSQEFLFRPISFCKKKSTYVLRGEKCISYTTARDIFMNAIQAIGLDKCKYSLHSLRAGGASSAANFGISDRIFKKHGRWSSDTAKDGYVTENLSIKLSVTKNLGI
jgi:hypothetical protein